MTHKHPYVRRAAALVAIASTLALGACASKGVAPTGEMADARASISQAESAGATQSAPVELLSAREKLGLAEAALREERFADARRLAERSAADAELAERKARAEKAQAASEALRRANATLQQELSGKR